ncbi:MAG TPA: sugar phosphate isomerase/epimerase family protein [Terriglobia bacterium]|nr:sugar phosphate isomerase/epimerase family protein [Terriglobia bacterium]
MMTRRTFLTTMAAAGAAAHPAMAGDGFLVAQSLPRTSMGVNIYSFGFGQRGKSTLEFLDYCAALGAGGIQAELSSLDSDSIKKLRERAEKLEMYLEIITGLPKDDSIAFERDVVAAKSVGAICIRSACLNGRRYETFSNLDDWRHFVSDSKARIARALPILEKHKMPMGIENHKDWTIDELVALMKEHSSEYFGVCLDTGNNISLLDDPMDVVTRLAPYAISTHIKDMAVSEYAEGFLLAEVPMGSGMLDMRAIARTIAKARPRTKFTLEMITRNPLKIPCLTEKYWATFPARNGAFLARSLTMVRTNPPRSPLPEPESMEASAHRQLEEDNVRTCLAYASSALALKSS